MAKFARPPFSALWRADIESYVVPQPGLSYDDDDPLVTAHPEAFCTAAELEEAGKPQQFPESVVVEDASKPPGRKRATKRA